LLTNINLDDSNKPSDVIDENEKLNVVVIA
jgi:hypothetical protein